MQNYNGTLDLKINLTVLKNVYRYAHHQMLVYFNFER